jgi:hypothetical protein
VFAGVSRGGQEADPEMKVMANPQPSRAVRRHAAAHVLGDLGPRVGVGRQHRVRPLARVGRDETGIVTIKQYVLGLDIWTFEANAGLGPSEAEDLRVIARDQLLEGCGGLAHVWHTGHQ